MTCLLRSRFVMFLTCIAVGMAACGNLVAKKGGNGGGNGGGGDPPAEPTVHYLLHRFTMPADYFGGTVSQEINDVLEVVGWYRNPLIEGTEQPFYFDATSGETRATNLNEIEFDASFGLPVDEEGVWYINTATDINNMGDISCSLGLVGNSDRLRGAVIEMRPDPADPSLKPRIHLIPDEAWSHTYARSINDVGVVLGRGDSETSYVYQVPFRSVVDVTAVPTPVTVIPTPFDAWYSGHLTNPINDGPTLVYAGILYDTNEYLTYNVDTGASSFTDVSGLDIADIRGFVASWLCGAIFFLLLNTPRVLFSPRRHGGHAKESE